MDCDRKRPENEQKIRKKEKNCCASWWKAEEDGESIELFGATPGHALCGIAAAAWPWLDEIAPFFTASGATQQILYEIPQSSQDRTMNFVIIKVSLQCGRFVLSLAV